MKWFAVISAFLFSSLSYAGIGSIGEPNVIWSKNHIHVCWKNSEDPLENFTEIEKQTVKKAIETEYTIPRVGIDFYGWEDCSSLDSKEINLQLIQSSDEAAHPSMDSDLMGLASIGESGKFEYQLQRRSYEVLNTGFGYYQKSGKQPFVQLKAERLQKNLHFTYLENLYFVAIHEFGHVAGLRHEYIRSEAAYDRNCYLRKKISETQNNTAKKYTNYDANSIMNYCWMDMLYINGVTWYQSKANRELQSKMFNEDPLNASRPLMNSDLEFSILPVLGDVSLYSVTYDHDKKIFKYEIKVGLSQKDVQSLRCMYVNPLQKECN